MSKPDHSAGPDSITGQWSIANGNAVAFELQGRRYEGFYGITKKKKNKVKAVLSLDANGNQSFDENDPIFGRASFKIEYYKSLPETASGSFSLTPNNGKLEFFLKDDFIGKGMIFNPYDFLG